MLKSEFRELLTIPVGEVFIEGSLFIPPGSTALVIFSHGTGSGRFSPRNNFVANILNRNGISTFLPDLLTIEEDEIYKIRFDINLLTERLIAVTEFLDNLPVTSGLRKGYFGASTGAASALRAAAMLPAIIKAVVSKGGRPDLAIDMSERVKAPTLLIVGSLDYQVITLNEIAYSYLGCKKEFTLVDGATHLFEEPGTLKQVSMLANQWYDKHLVHNKKVVIRIE